MVRALGVLATFGMLAATTRLHIERNWVYDDQATKTQQYGMNVLTGTTQTDLLVMGAYGHSRLREMILGGATRDVLATTTVPILMAH